MTTDRNDILSEQSIGADRRWLTDTMTRVALRYGRALHELSAVPGLIALANLRPDPYAPDAQHAAEAISATVYRAVEELDRIALYVEAITDPGPVTCDICSCQLVIRTGDSDFTHWRWVPDPDAPLMRWCEEFEADHHALPIYGAPDRPDWRTHDTDLTSEQRTDA